MGPITLVDPVLPPAPVIGSNAPICVGLTLLLYGSDDKPGGSFSWAGPNGFSSSAQNPVIPDVTTAAQGVYTLSYTWLNCTNTTTADIQLQPVIQLTDVKAVKYIIPFGDSVLLNASGATFYNWTPHNGTIRNPYIYNPFVRPVDSISVYTVHGMNEWGCHDSADIILRVIFDEDEYIPSAFTPNGDGKNDIFRIGKMKYKKLIDFTVYNRWGQEVYHNPYDIYGGWDGTSGGKAQDMGVYYYSITIENAGGKIKYYKGDVTLLR
jgi:gliding motility-associated-like protein